MLVFPIGAFRARGRGGEGQERQCGAGRSRIPRFSRQTIERRGASAVLRVAWMRGWHRSKESRHSLLRISTGRHN